MKIKLTNSTMVKPFMTLTPTTNLWLSNLDVQMPMDHHTLFIYFYRSTGEADFFDPSVLKAALSRALVEFYPVAGRLKRENNGRIEINCNGEGVLFVEAEADGEMDGLGDFGPKPELGLIPAVDYSLGISTYPLLLLQLTHFKCGGVCLGVANEHHLSDGYSAIHFINTWSDIARGLQVIATPPFLDRTILHARNPPKPEFSHIEYQPPPQMKTPPPQHDNPNKKTLTFSIFKLTRDQLNTLKANCKDIDEVRRYSTYEVLAGHIWRCVCKARGLPKNQETKMQIPIDGRFRMQPSLPRGYFGNVIFSATTIVLCGEIESSPLDFAVSKIHDAIARMNNDYLRSALDYLDLNKFRPRDHGAVQAGAHPYNCPNFGIVSWAKLPIYDADFGWGTPVYMGPARIPSEGETILMQSPTNDGGLLFAISMPKQEMEIFEKLLYDI